MRKVIFLILLTIILNNIYSNDKDVADRIATVLIEEYDNYRDRTFTEKLVLKFGKKAFIDSVLIWKVNFRTIDSIEIKLHYQLEKMAKISDDNLSLDESEKFRELLKRLTYLGYKNLDLYYRAVKEYLDNNKNFLNQADISIETIDDAISNNKYFTEKKKLYFDEEMIKNEIRLFFDNRKIKYKISFYSFAFEFFDKIRRQIIAKDLKKIEERIKE